MSLADELLADFDEEIASEEENAGEGFEDRNEVVDKQELDRELGSVGLDHDGQINNDIADKDTILQNDRQITEKSPAEVVAGMKLQSVDDVRSVARLLDTIQPLLDKVAVRSRENRTSIEGNVEDDPDYKLMVEANSQSVEIDNEIMIVHKFIRDHYAVRFSELESLILNPIDYAKTVQLIGNDLENIPTRSDLREILPGATYMVIAMSATQTSGKPLGDAELHTIMQACQLIQNLSEGKQLITDFVSARLSLFAPNTSELVGSHTAAQIIGFVGGIAGLSKTPSCNLPALGTKRQVGIGLSHIGIRQQGYLFHSSLVQSVPSDVRKQAMRMLAGKVVLTARMDMMHENMDGSLGIKLRQQLEEKLEKLTVPPENKGPKALPIPEDKPSKKRGGRRFRKWKEQFGMTELRKAQNRMGFNKPEDEVGVDDETVGLGMIGQTGTGQVRQTKVDNKARAKLSKGMQARISGLSSSIPGRRTEVNGTQSSLTFTPLQGIELVDPSAVERRPIPKDDRWFSGGTFSMVGKGTSNTNNNAKTNMGPPPLKKHKPS